MKAVLYDLDGTLVDSEPAWAAAMRSLAGARGTVVSDAVLHEISGMDSAEAMRFVHRQFNWPAGEFANDLAYMQHQVMAALRRHVAWQPGAAALVAATRERGLATALVTSTYRPVVSVVLASLGVEFDVVKCGDEGGTPAKPHPGPYLWTLDALGLAPDECVVIEDSQRGVDSARLAGCPVLHVNPHFTAAGATAHVPDLTQVTPEFLATLTAPGAPAHRTASVEGAPGRILSTHSVPAK